MVRTGVMGETEGAVGSDSLFLFSQLILRGNKIRSFGLGGELINFLLQMGRV